jgi:hypothetical protein
VRSRLIASCSRISSALAFELELELAVDAELYHRLVLAAGPTNWNGETACDLKAL